MNTINNFPYEMIDLTHLINPSIPCWDEGCGFQHETILDYQTNATDTEVSFRIQKIHSTAGIGTHIDAPAHCIPGGQTIEALDLKKLITSCIMIDVSHEAHEYYQFSVQNIKRFEQEHGTIPEHSLVIIHTGWSQFWHDANKYRNNLQFPSITKDAAQVLLERNIAGLGIDTLSPDVPTSGYIVHKMILGSGKYIVENIAHAHQLPPTGSLSLFLPMAIQSGTEASVRLLSLIPINKIFILFPFN